jgi:hypothetical protein
MLGEGHKVSFRLDGNGDVRVDPGDVKVLAMKDVGISVILARTSTSLMLSCTGI